MHPRRAVWLVPPFLLVLALGCAPCKRCLYEGFNRDDWQQPDRVIAALEIEPGDRVADLGAGGGYFTFRLADAVGPKGRVYAVDVDAGMTDYLAKRASEEGYANVEVILAEYDDPGLLEASVDLLFTSNTYHHLENRSDYFRRVRRSLRAGGRVAIIEYKRTGWFQRIFPHFTPVASIRAEMKAAGYRLEREHDFLPKQSFLVFSVAETG